MFALLFAVAAAASGGEPDAKDLDTIVARCRVAPATDTDDFVDAYCLHDIGLRGAAAERAGPKVAEHLTSPKLQDRARAAVALGMIGYRPAVPALVEATEGDDWRLTMAAVRSLGWLKAVEARDAVERVARTHMLAAVRRIAADALAAIDGVRESAPDFDADHLDSREPFQLVDHPYGDASNRCENGPWRWNGRTIELGVGPARTTFAPLRGVGENEQSMPWGISAELVVDGGRLVGTNRGEWGGELYYEADGKPARKIDDGNVVDIVHGPDGIVAIGGVSHMVFDVGDVVVVERTTGGYKAGRELPLPSSPLHVVPVDATALLISTSTVNVVLRRGGRLEDAACADVAAAAPTAD